MLTHPTLEQLRQLKLDGLNQTGFTGDDLVPILLR